MSASLFAVLNLVSYLAAGGVALLSVAWIARAGPRQRRDRGAALAAVLLTATWCVCVAAVGVSHPFSAAAESLRNLGWLYALLRLFANDGRDESLRPVRPAIAALVFVEVLQLALLTARLASPDRGMTSGQFETSAILHVLLAIGALVIVHNAHIGAAMASRLLLRWNIAAMLALWAFTLNFSLLAWLTGSVPQALVPVQALVAAFVVTAYAAGFSRGAAELHFRPSRTATFHLLSLLVISLYILAVAFVAHWLAALSSDASMLLQMGTLATAAALALLWLPAKSARAWLRITVLKHLFRHRYDYRAEWLRFTQTIATGGPGSDSDLAERAIKALADLTDSPGGLLFAPDEGRDFTCAAEWNWPADVDRQPTYPAAHARLMEVKAAVIDIGAQRASRNPEIERVITPPWLLSCETAWAAVPLMHFERLVGIVVLARPDYERTLDWEDFDMLEIVGRQLASYLAERAGQVALMEAARFDEFNRRMAFVMHDIKNLASQLSLLTRNAERHADKPEFQRDMLLTVRNSAGKLEALLARLGRYVSGPAQPASSIELRQAAAALAARFGPLHPLRIVRAEPAEVEGRAEGLEQALAHLVQNAIDASVDGAPVLIEVYSDGLHGMISIIDSGQGMTAAFVREGLFKPFVSSKQGGFGIGAYEARETIRAMGGSLDVESRVGLGSRFTVSLPLKAARQVLEAAGQRAREAA